MEHSFDEEPQEPLFGAMSKPVTMDEIMSMEEIMSMHMADPVSKEQEDINESQSHIVEACEEPSHKNEEHKEQYSTHTDIA